jgi:hypothetical protein
MKRFFKNAKAIVASMLTVAVVSSSMVSCQYDDTEIWEKLDEIEQEIADLRTQVEQELNAIRDMVNGLVTVTDVKQQQDGSKQIILSDGTKINVYPEAAEVPANIVTTSANAHESALGRSRRTRTRSCKLLTSAPFYAERLEFTRRTPQR